MRRFTEKTPAINAAIVLSMVAVFFGDLYTPLGLVIWVFYLVPVVLAKFTWRPGAPVAVAAIATILMVLSFLSDSPGASLQMAALNRGFGILTLWTIGILGRLFVSNKLAVRKQEWFQSGQTRLSEKMRGDKQLPELGEAVLRTLAEYLDARAGAIFIEDSGAFRRFASYAIPEGAFVPTEIQMGDGLLGQALKDNRIFLVSDVPEGYLKIGSSLGQSSPRNLLVAPLAVEGKPNAVMELGFLRAVYESDIELIERVSESIAVAARSTQYRTRLQELLEKTQNQAEQLQTQSEELRVSNEELEEQSRALKESQVRLEQQQAELEQTNEQLEDQMQLLEAQKAEVSQAKTLVERQARELEQSSRYKSEFLANMSHELRTPLNSSLILSRLLAENRSGNLTDEQIKYAQTIESSGNDLLTLINDVLDLAKVEAGYLEVKPECMSLSHLVENLRTTFHHVAAQKSLRLLFQMSPETPPTIQTDPQRLEQVLKNLLSNALKFTEKGEVALEIQPRPNSRVAFSVRDTGMGISREQQEVIFEPFCQGDGSIHRKYGGTGLGLSISREFVRLLGGEIQLASKEGEGSTFTVILPEANGVPIASGSVRGEVAPPPRTLPSSQHSGIVTPATPIRVKAVEPASEPHQPLPAARVDDDRTKLDHRRRLILIVEDDEPFARVLRDQAHQLNFQTIIATTAAEALLLTARYSPSAVVLDIGLPDNSGLVVLDRLKKNARTRHVPVHVLSGLDYTQTALSMGAVGYMLKPVRREQLVEAFRSLETHITRKPRRVLIVEDDPRQRESLGELLGSQEVETVGVGSAAECLEKLRGSTFDCMVLDLSLPDATGFSVLDTLSREDTYAFPPVIVYTGRELKPDEEQRLRKFSSSIIIKGAKSPERLLDEVTLFLHQVVADLPPEQQKMIERAHHRDSTLEGRVILVVEDDVRNVFALASILEPRGMTVLIARNGREALDLLHRSTQPGNQPVDLVLMDLMMPEMDGLTAMREIRKRSEWKNLPIIALTAKAMKSDQEHSLAAGANDYMAKPLDVERLLSLVRVWMPR